MRFILIMLAVFIIGLAAWFVLRDDGLLETVTEARVEKALRDNGAPPELASCMAGKMVDDLTITQLRKLEALSPEEGEDRVPRSADAALARLRRVDDPEAVRVLAASGTTCGIEILRQRVEDEFERQRLQ